LFAYDVYPRFEEKLFPVKLQGLDPNKSRIQLPVCYLFYTIKKGCACMAARLPSLVSTIFFPN
jgi:hypothetical protein